MAAQAYIEAGQGETFDRTVTWEVGPDRDNRTPVDITGYSARLQVRRKHTSADTVFSLTDTDGLTLGDAAGTVQIQLSATDTADVSGKYVFDLELESPGGVVTRIVEGVIEFTPEVTR